jgi:hypothetical protein
MLIKKKNNDKFVLKNELLKLKEEKDFQSFKKLLPNID